MPGAIEDLEDRDAQDARDADLVAAGAYGELLAAYYPRIYQILRLKRLSRDDAEEVRQRVVEHLLVEQDGHVVTLTMNRPDAKNAFSPEMLVGLADAWDWIDSGS